MMKMCIFPRHDLCSTLKRHSICKLKNNNRSSLPYLSILTDFQREVLLPQAQVILDDFGYPGLGPSVFFIPKSLKLFGCVHTCRTLFQESDTHITVDIYIHFYFFHVQSSKLFLLITRFMKMKFHQIQQQLPKI